ncbi:thioredoxin superfamily protein [Actinidia rufa]|uniref:Thioredoxin superfamily protein n=1 Tax=Actinidia rufa TaxID=165716 RepID=A0A7J0GCG6_9ERIC|nr:thioredoxin superfamily protein [Actinidia rufa]
MARAICCLGSAKDWCSGSGGDGRVDCSCGGVGDRGGIWYSNKNLSFGIVDLGLFPNAAEKFGISLGSSDKLPTFILFESGIEITRFPELDFVAKAFNPPISKKLLCRHFELDRHLLDYINGK